MEAYPDLPGPEPSAYDVLITDISPEDLPGAVSRFLGMPYLAHSAESEEWPARGGIYGVKRRVLFSLPMSIRGAPASAVNVHFVFDTGAPATYISRSTVRALGLEEWSVDSARLLVNGRSAGPVLVSDSMACHFAGLNILGMDFLDRHDLVMTVDMRRMRATMALPDAA